MQNSLYKRNMIRNNSKIAYLHILLARGFPTISNTYICVSCAVNH